MTRLQTLSLAATLASTILCASFGLAQDRAQPRDDALDGLLKKLEEAKAPDTAKPSASEKDKTGTPRKSGDLESKDKALDSLLEKLGETTETPAPDDKPRGAPGPGRDQPPGQPGKGQDKPKGDDLKGEAKDLDQHLEELTGRKPKKKGRDQERDGDGNSPLAKVIKEMRDVEQRLGKPDTGEETRKKQAEIVKNLETLIEQLKKSSSQSQGKTKKMLGMKPGSQPASKSDQNQGAMAKGVGKSMPEKPTSKRSLAGGKDEWGHLPEALRMEMENVFKEEGLPKKVELIRRYYLSLSKKMLVREE